MQNIIDLLRSVEGKPLSKEDRVEKAILLASWIQTIANQNLTKKEKQFQEEISRLVKDPKGKVLALDLFDQSFRSKNPLRVANQIHYLLRTYGPAEFLQGLKKWGISLFATFSPTMTQFLVPLLKSFIRQEAGGVILPNDLASLRAWSQKERKRGTLLNINHLGEAILGQEEAERRLNQYLKDLETDEISYISVKISTLYSQINLIDYKKTLEALAESYRKLLRKCKHKQKFVNLDMEEYRDLRLTVDLFKKVLSEPEFKNLSGGIVLQSYLPDSFDVQQELTEFALERVREGGAPIKIRLVKGANLAMERVEAAIKGWPQAPYETKLETDTNFKKMMEYGLEKAHLKAVHIGIGSHNLFDISYAMLMQRESKIGQEVSFEMLEGMAPSVRRMIQRLTHQMVIYLPTADDEEFQYAIAYLVRRLDENAGHDNYLRMSFLAEPRSSAWQHQADLFASSCMATNEISHRKRRFQNRFLKPSLTSLERFQNVADTDWSLQENRDWIYEEKEKWVRKKIDPVPSVIAEREYLNRPQGVSFDPSNPKKPFYYYHLASFEEIDLALNHAKSSRFISNEKAFLKAANLFEEKRGDLIGTMLMDVGKPVMEGDVEVSEAVDFLRYYYHSKNGFKEFKEIELTAKGTVVVASPWNFPLSIPVGGISAALMAGNKVIFKPAPEAILTGYELAKVFWEAGVSRGDLQFISCQDEEAGRLVKDQRVDAVILTGGTATARQILRERPGVDLMAETGGKNTMIVTAMADRDLAIKDILQSAFGFAGQKCSALSVLILEKEVFEDENFKNQLRDATNSLKVGSAWEFGTKIPPLTLPLSDTLKKGMQLEEGESWLVKPILDKENSHLLSPGIKWNVKVGNYAQTKELFGPILAVMKADNLEEAIQMANQTEYGLTAGIHTLDPREQKKWLEYIEAGNCYINRGITGAVVERQPFGGTKASVFGPGAKAGGPNYLLQLSRIREKKFPEELAAPPKSVRNWLEKLADLDTAIVKKLKKRAGNYSFWWKHFFSKDHDPAFVLGQDNLQRYKPFKHLELRAFSHDSLEDLISVAIACEIVGTSLNISLDSFREELKKIPLKLTIETDQEFIARISQVKYNRIRLISDPEYELKMKLSDLGLWIAPTPVYNFGRIELLHYLREVSISQDYHRYGNLGAKENEIRNPLVASENGHGH